MKPSENTEPSLQWPPTASGWRHFEHRADIGVEGVGGSPAEAFAQAALALTAVVCDPAAVQPAVALDLACEAPDLELLLADWLNAVIYRMATERMLFSRFDVRIEAGQLHATIHGEPVDRQRHQPAVEVKGATYTGLSVTGDADGRWTARCVVDV
jgi:SHS2 domain-containing protein